MRSSFRLGAGWLTLLLLGGCAGEPPQEARPRAAAEGARGFEAATSPAGALADGTLDTTARKLAGLDAGDEEPWTAHAEQMEALWQEAERRHLNQARTWSAASFAPLVPRPDLTLFYPFGGPDFLSSWLFFPDAPVHVLVGLQPPGRLPRLDGVSSAELERLRGGFESLVEAGYFQQTDMDRDFDAERLDGMLPVLYIFLARTGHRLLAVRHLVLDEEGSPVEPGADEAATAVEIEFVRDGEDTVRRLLYFSQDLSDQGLTAGHGAFRRYLMSLGEWNVLMKAAVYLLQMEGFTVLRDLLLERTGTLLQDDSGLPLRDLVGAGWEIEAFGRYSKTLPVYREWFQEDLKALFDEAGASRPLPFAIGYHSQIGEGCLIVANRQAVPGDPG